jgi:hypothetical protein
VPEAAFRPQVDERIEHLRRPRSAVVGEQQRAIGRAGDHDLEDATVTGHDRQRF